MKTFNRSNTSNVKQAKKRSRHLRDLRKNGGNISLFKDSGRVKPSFADTFKSRNQWRDDDDGYGLGAEQDFS